MSDYHRAIDEQPLTVADLIAILRKFPGDTPVEATCSSQDCQEPGGQILSVGVVDGGHVEIVGEYVPRPRTRRHTPAIYPTA